MKIVLFEKLWNVTIINNYIYYNMFMYITRTMKLLTNILFFTFSVFFSVIFLVFFFLIFFVFSHVIFFYFVWYWTVAFKTKQTLLNMLLSILFNVFWNFMKLLNATFDFLFFSFIFCFFLGNISMYNLWKFSNWILLLQHCSQIDNNL